MIAGEVRGDQLKAGTTAMNLCGLQYRPCTIIPPSDWSSPYTSPASFKYDPKISTTDRVICCLLCGSTSCNHTIAFGKKFQSSSIATLRQQPLPLKSVFTDSTVPTLNFSTQPRNSDDRQKMVPAEENGTRVDRSQASISAVDLLVQKPESTSESGWTTYLDQSASWSEHSRRLIRPVSGIPCLRKDEEDFEGTLDEECREDSSMASDASSGPEQPEFLRRERLKRNLVRKTKEPVAKALPSACYDKEDELDDTCQSNLSCESVSDDPRPERRQSKRRKVMDVESNHLNQPASASEIGDGHSDENEVEFGAGEAEICSRPPVYIDRNDVDSRLEALQHLIPHSRELDEEQVLEVAIDYVKSLEEKIKTFEAAVNSKRRLSSADNSTCLSTAGALQEKGLCLFPISMVATS